MAAGLAAAAARALARVAEFVPNEQSPKRGDEHGEVMPHEHQLHQPAVGADALHKRVDGPTDPLTVPFEFQDMLAQEEVCRFRPDQGEGEPPVAGPFAA